MSEQHLPLNVRGYDLREPVGEGGYGVVYRAYQHVVGRDVAIKIILPQHANQPEFIRRFESEAQLVARLEHPYIVPLYDYWREPNGAFLVMRYLRGGSLLALLRRGPLPLSLLDRALDQIGGALAAAHRRGVVHRDLKPGNVLLDDEGNIYLADFGIAKDIGKQLSPYQTDQQVVVGSPAYLAPEQIKAEPISPQTDIYSFGVMLYEILTGKLPFDAPTPMAMMFMHVNQPLPPVRAHRPDLPGAVDLVIQRATAKEPAERYPHVAAMVAALREALDQPGTAAGRAAPQRPRSPYETGQIRVPTQLLAPQQAENPYKGLRAFGEADAADFFGRAALTEQLLARMREPHPLARFLAVVGPSGSGKSSVVRAGLVPALKRGALPGAERWFVLDLHPGAQPIEELAQALVRVAVDPPDDLVAPLLLDSRGLLRVVDQAVPGGDETEVVLVIDQFEELFTLVADGARRRHFLDTIVAAATDPYSRMRVVVTLRADFYDRPLQYPEFGALLRQRTEVVLPLAPGELEQAIAAPAQRVGVAAAPDLVAAIVGDVGAQPGALPLLQYALTELFEQRTGAALTLAAYRASGGMQGALARRADALYAGLPPAAQPAARQLFLRLINLGEGAEDTRRRARYAELSGGPAAARQSPAAAAEAEAALEAVLEVYGRARLLTFDRDPATREPTVEVAHEALIRHWQRLRAWLDAARAELRIQRQLAAAAAEWAASRYDASFLASGARLAQFAAVASGGALALNAHEQAYLDTSLAQRDRQAQGEREQQQRELAQAQALAEEQRQRAEIQAAASQRLRRRALWLAAALASAGILLLAAALLGGFAFQQRNLARQQRQAALARQLAAQSLINAGDSSRAVLLALEAARLDPEAVEVRGSLLAGLEASPRLLSFLPGHSNIVYSVAFSPDGKILASASQDGTIILRDVATRQPIGQPLTGHTSWVTSVAFSPDGKTLASASDDKTIRLWDAATHQPIGQPLQGHGSAVWSVAFSPDGKTLASGSNDNTIRLWDTATHQPIGQPLAGHTNWVRSVAFSPDGKTLASGSWDSTIRLWNVATQQPIGEPLTGHADWVRGVAFSPDGKTLASASADKTVILWDVATRQPIGQPLAGHTSVVYSLAFSPDGKTLASASADKTVILWDVATRQPIDSQSLSGHAGNIQSVAFSPDGTLLASASDDTTVGLWSIAARQQLGQALAGHTDSVIAVAFSPDGTLLASGSDDSTVMLWDAATRQPVGRPLRGHTQGVWSVAFSPDGKTLASGGADRIINLWDVATRQPIGQPLSGHTDRVRSVVFSPDGKTLASASDDNTIILWDVATRRSRGAPLAGHTDWALSLAFSPDGKTLASGGADNRIILWDVASGKRVATLSGHSWRVWAVAFSPDGKTLASGSQDSAMILWDVATRQRIGGPFIQNNTVNGVAFSPDGRLLAISDQDGSVALWDAQARQQLGRRLLGHSSWARTVAFSPDSQTLASGSGDSTIILWDVRFASWQAQACQLANRNLSWEEWRQYLGDEPYHKTCAAAPVHPSVLEAARNQARAGDQAGAVALFKQALALDPGLQLDPEREAGSLAARHQLANGGRLAQQGKVQDAIAAFVEAQRLDPTLDISADDLNTLCWYGSLWGGARQVLGACDRAVELDPQNGDIHDSRGLARALSGDTAGAIEDFKQFVAWSQGKRDYDASRTERQRWLGALEAGQNPFDDATIAALR